MNKYYLKEIKINILYSILFYLNTSSITLLMFSIYMSIIYNMSELIDKTTGLYIFYKTKNEIKILKNEISCYRIENKNQIGPYHIYPKIINNIAKNNTPTPEIDLKEKWIYILYKNEKEKFKFAFNKENDIYKWFTKEEIEILNKNNFEIVEYKIKEYLKSKKQLIFNIEKAKINSKKSLNLQYFS